MKSVVALICLLDHGYCTVLLASLGSKNGEVEVGALKSYDAARGAIEHIRLLVLTI
jgi:hypothetical protein